MNLRLLTKPQGSSIIEVGLPNLQKKPQIKILLLGLTTISRHSFVKKLQKNYQQT